MRKRKERRVTGRAGERKMVKIRTEGDTEEREGKGRKK